MWGIWTVQLLGLILDLIRHNWTFFDLTAKGMTGRVGHTRQKHYCHAKTLVFESLKPQSGYQLMLCYWWHTESHSSPIMSCLDSVALQGNREVCVGMVTPARPRGLQWLNSASMSAVVSGLLTGIAVRSALLESHINLFTHKNIQWTQMRTRT